MTDNTQRPMLTFLSQEDKDRIYKAALEILEKIGMRILQDEALALLKGAGCALNQDGLVLIPNALVEKAVKSAPNNISVFDREGNPAMELGGYRSYFGTGSDLIFALDGQTMERRQCVLEDVRRAALVADALPNLDFIMSFAHPNDIIPQRAYLASFQAMAENSTKPIVCTAVGKEDLGKMWEVGVILRGSEEALRSKPYLIHYAEPISPLKHPAASLDKLLLCAKKGIPVIYSPAPIAGSTAPMTMAGHVAQGLAECFCGLVIHQLKAEGAPFLMGMGAAVLDMATSQCSYNAPEYLLSYAAMIEMSRYFDIPNWGYAGTSDAQIPDGQATFESGLLSFLSTMTGSNLNHDVGYLDFGRTGSLDFMVMGDEFIDQIRRLHKGIPVDDETLALETIGEVGPEGHFLSQPHTLKHLRGTQWRPKLIHRAGYDKWVDSGSTSLLDRAKQKLRKIMETHKPVALAEEKRKKIQELVDGYKPS